MKFLQKYGDWARTFCVLLAIGATQFLDLRFVAKAAYEEDQKATRKSLIDLSTAIALLQQTTKIQDDHESRLRALEHSLKANNDYEVHDYDSFSPPLRAGAY